MHFFYANRSWVQQNLPIQDLTSFSRLRINQSDKNPKREGEEKSVRHQRDNSDIIKPWSARILQSYSVKEAQTSEEIGWSNPPDGILMKTERIDWVPQKDIPSQNLNYPLSLRNHQSESPGPRWSEEKTSDSIKPTEFFIERDNQSRFWILKRERIDRTDFFVSLSNFTFSRFHVYTFLEIGFSDQRRRLIELLIDLSKLKIQIRTLKFLL